MLLAHKPKNRMSSEEKMDSINKKKDDKEGRKELKFMALSLSVG